MSAPDTIGSECIKLELVETEYECACRKCEREEQ